MQDSSHFEGHETEWDQQGSECRQSKNQAHRQHIKVKGRNQQMNKGEQEEDQESYIVEANEENISRGLIVFMLIDQLSEDWKMAIVFSNIGH